MSQQVQDFFSNVLKSESEVHEDLGGNALLLAEQPQQQVLGADIVVIEVARLLDRVLDHLLGARRLGQLAGGADLGAGLDKFLDFEADLAEIDVEILEDIGGDAGAFLDQSQKDVLGADVLVVEPLRLLAENLAVKPHRGVSILTQHQ